MSTERVEVTNQEETGKQTVDKGRATEGNAAAVSTDRDRTQPVRCVADLTSRSMIASGGVNRGGATDSAGNVRS